MDSYVLGQGDFALPKKPERTFLHGERVLLVYASQSGTAEAFAQQIYQCNQAQCDLVNLALLKPNTLEHYGRLIFIVASFGDGAAPSECAASFAALKSAALNLSGINFAVLALGNRQYRRFCGFGKTLSHTLQGFGASARIPMTEVHQGDQSVFVHWWSILGETFDIDVERDDAYLIATVMDDPLRDEVAGRTEIAFYIEALQYEAVDYLLFKSKALEREDGAAQSLIRLAVSSTEHEPFVRVVIFDQALDDSTEGRFKRTLIACELGDKWQVTRA